MATILPVLIDFNTRWGCVIAQSNGDLGDAPQRSAMFYIGRSLHGQPTAFGVSSCIARLTNERGELVRDPNEWNNPKDISRDQQEPWLIMLGLYGLKRRARFMIFARWQDGGRFPNGDIMNPTTLATDLRVLGWWWLYPLILFGDLWTCVAALIDCVKAKIHDGADGPWLDMDNAVTRTAYYQQRFWSPFAWLAREIYRDLFPDNVGGQGVLGALKNKHRKEAGGNPAMALLWEGLL